MQPHQQPPGQPSQPSFPTEAPVHDFRNPAMLQSPGSLPPQAAWQPPITQPAAPYGRNAAFLTRFFALLIDGILLGLAIGLLAIAGSILIGVSAVAVGPDLSSVVGVLALLVLIPLGILIVASYHVILETGPAQGTLGKQWLGIRIVTLEGHTISRGRSLARLAVRYFLSGAFFGLGYWLALFTARKQALHDLIVETVVVER